MDDDGDGVPDTVDGKGSDPKNAELRPAVVAPVTLTTVTEWHSL